MTTPREFNLTTALEEIHNSIGKMQIITGQESRSEQMLYKYHQAPREWNRENLWSKQTCKVQNFEKNI